MGYAGVTEAENEHGVMEFVATDEFPAFLPDGSVCPDGEWEAEWSTDPNKFVCYSIQQSPADKYIAALEKLKFGNECVYNRAIDEAIKTIKEL